MTPPDAADRIAAETWFLQRGLPSVLTPRARWGRLWQRSAPGFAGYAVLELAALVITTAAGGDDVDIDANVAPAELLILAVLITCLPLTALVIWRVSVIPPGRGRSIAAAVSAGIVASTCLLPSAFGDKLVSLFFTGIALGVIVLGTGSGIGSVLGWAVRLTMTNLASLGQLVARALPVVLLTVLVFFNGYVWSMATKLSRDRMWLIVIFLLLIAVAFLLSGTVDRVRPVLAQTSTADLATRRLEDTPFDEMADPDSGDPLSRGEQINVMFVIAASQLTQILAVAFVTMGIFMTLGLLALSPELLSDWTKNGSVQGTLLGMNLPVPQALVHVTMFLGALTFMYVSARAVGDGDYRSRYLDPLVDDLYRTLVARNRYRAHVGLS